MAAQRSTGSRASSSDPGDRELFRTLRERADAVLVGPATLAAENYGRMLPQAERRERRIAAGRSAEPLVVTISTQRRDSRSSIPLFAEPEATSLSFSPSPPRSRPRLAAHLDHLPLQPVTGRVGPVVADPRRNHGVPHPAV